MRERTGQILKMVCLVLAALLLYQLVQMARRVNPLSHVTIPALPKLAADTNAPDKKVMTNLVQISSAKGTNAPHNGMETNSAAARIKRDKETNAASAVLAGQNFTNSPAVTNGSLATTGVVARVALPTNEIAEATNSQIFTPLIENSPASLNTNVSLPALLTEISSPNAPSESITNNSLAMPGTNLSLAVAVISTNLSPRTNHTATNNLLVAAGSNSVAVAKSKKKGTNSIAPPSMAMVAMNNSSAMRGGPASALPPEIKARVDRIYESELFGQVMHPVPMGLLGIAGNSAFLRAPSGQTGLVKAGDSLGEIKLLRIGINRVLVEQDGKKSELMIFDGYGGESLMPKDKETSK